MEKKAKGMLFCDNRTFKLSELCFPEPKADQVLVKCMATGVCGTDIHIYHGEKGSAEVCPPVVLGHEIAGLVEEIGPDVTTVRKGDRVAIDPNIYCGNCMSCRMGNKQNCENLFAFGVNANGGFAQYCMVPQSQCFLLKSHIEFDAGAMMEPLACALHGIDRAQIRPGQTVLIIGGGAIGLLMVQLAKLSGAGCVLLSEPVKMRREVGLRLGADGIIDSTKEDLCKQIYFQSGRRGVDVVIECVGSVLGVEQAFQAAGLGATILLFSVPKPDAVVSLPLFRLFQNEWKIVGSFINPDTNQRAVNLINSNRIDTQTLVTHHFGLKEVEKAIKKQTEPDSIKVMVHPQE
jgi:L-iditol 2-dehydrogenase